MHIQQTNYSGWQGRDVYKGNKQFASINMFRQTERIKVSKIFYYIIALVYKTQNLVSHYLQRHIINKGIESTSKDALEAKALKVALFSMNLN